MGREFYMQHVCVFGEFGAAGKRMKKWVKASPESCMLSVSFVVEGSGFQSRLHLRFLFHVVLREPLIQLVWRRKVGDRCQPTPQPGWEPLVTDRVKCANEITRCGFQRVHTGSCAGGCVKKGPYASQEKQSASLSSQCRWEITSSLVEVGVEGVKDNYKRASRRRVGVGWKKKCVVRLPQRCPIKERLNVLGLGT